MQENFDSPKHRKTHYFIWNIFPVYLPIWLRLRWQYSAQGQVHIYLRYTTFIPLNISGIIFWLAGKFQFLEFVYIPSL